MKPYYLKGFDDSWDTSGIPELVGRKFKLKSWTAPTYNKPTPKYKFWMNKPKRS